MKPTDLLPAFPRTQHLPYKPNAVRDDLVSSEEETLFIFTEPEVWVEEKVDGANCGIVIYDDHPIIRNRNNILSKAYGRSRTPAKMQFASIYNWFYQNRKNFEDLYNLLGFEVSVYGEWMYALHGIKYDKLPSLFLAFDLYDFKKKLFLPTKLTREVLFKSGFSLPPLIHSGPLKNWKIFDEFCSQRSLYSSTDIREGVYVKVSNENEVTHRFKMVRHDFLQGCHWNKKQITKNKLAK